MRRGASLAGPCIQVLVRPQGAAQPDPRVSLEEAAALDLLMLRPHNVIRKLIDDAFLQARLAPRVVAELESTPTLIDAVANGLGAAILPLSAARLVGKACNAQLQGIAGPMAKIPLALCTLDRLAMSPAALAVKGILLELAEDLAVSIGATQSPELEEGSP